ncbi:hypothetical protein [Pandoraea sputorum]|uniref:Uncharacterized protein n=1 Tax=Pandoraea sputorum TaxID=93222 RepID=A0A5E5B6S5_9BURK|nr:hypothetical protein [Pandoraea sputorum]VVE80060.1 hypothetical protein PSP31121_02475 [Pandoraea sputorum]
MLSTIWQAARWRATPVLLMSLAACTGVVVDREPVPAVPAVPVGTSAAVTSTSRLPGPDLAYSINRRYGQTPGKCFVASPAFDCSGVMLRPAPAGGADTAFWQIGADEVNAGYARLSYARRDLPAVNLPASVGFVLADRPTAAGNGQPYDYVCGKAPLAQSLPPCPGNADDVGVSLWSVSNPSALAVQAIYYDVANGGQLSQALRYQKQYYDATGQWIPVLKATIGAGTATAFGFDERDQLDWGFAVIRDLEARHADTRMTCPGNTPGYNCAGVLIRITGCGPFHSWNPTQNSIDRNGVSFSFARVDMLMNLTHSGGPGVIMRELQAPTQYPLTWRCAFPVNAGTNSRPSSCGTANQDLRLCDARGITTAALWRTAHGAAPAAGCGLSPSVEQFAVLKELRQTYNNAHNEVVIAAWPQNIPEQLPIEAWFYPTPDARPGAQYIQQDYMEMTGHFMPVLQVVLTNPAGTIYSYHVEDQTGATNTGALLAAPDNWAACQSR